MTIHGASIVTITNVPELAPVNVNMAIPTNVQFSAGVSFWAGKPFYIAALKGYDDVMRQLIGISFAVALAAPRAAPAGRVLSAQKITATRSDLVLIASPAATRFLGVSR